MSKSKRKLPSLFLGSLLIVFCLFSGGLVAKPFDLTIITPHAVLINAKTGEILYEKRARDEIYPASTTKIATALLALRKKGDQLDEIITCDHDYLMKTTEDAKLKSGYTIPFHLLEVDGATLYLRHGQKFRLKDLLYAMMLTSANDAANIVAAATSGELTHHINDLNTMVQEIGCRGTFFSNPHGLFVPVHVSTPLDMAMLAREAMKDQRFREIVGSLNYPWKNGDKMVKQTNALLDPDSEFYYPKAKGIKTGYAKLAKYNLVACAENGERSLILALHKSPDSKQRFRDAITMFDVAFSEKKEQRLLFKALDLTFATSVLKASTGLQAILLDDIVYNFFPSEEREVRSEVCWYENSLPINVGDKVGEVVILDSKDEVIAKGLLHSICPVYEKWYIKFFRYWYLGFLMPIFIIILYVCVRKYKENHQV